MTDAHKSLSSFRFLGEGKGEIHVLLSNSLATVQLSVKETRFKDSYLIKAYASISLGKFVTMTETDC